jgi:hypothetical protein
MMLYLVTRVRFFLNRRRYVRRNEGFLTCALGLRPSAGEEVRILISLQFYIYKTGIHITGSYFSISGVFDQS